MRVQGGFDDASLLAQHVGGAHSGRETEHGAGLGMAGVHGDVAAAGGAAHSSLSMLHFAGATTLDTGSNNECGLHASAAGSSHQHVDTQAVPGSNDVESQQFQVSKKRYGL